MVPNSIIPSMSLDTASIPGYILQLPQCIKNALDYYEHLLFLLKPWGLNTGILLFSRMRSGTGAFLVQVGL